MTVAAAAGWSLASVALVSLLSLLGLLTLTWSEDRVRRIALWCVTFAVGALLGDAFLHLLPEALEQSGGRNACLWALAGMLGFFSLEKFLRGRHFHVHPHHAHAVAPRVVVNLVGDALHNLVDGMLVASSYLVSVPLGVATTIAVLLHELPQELGDFGILVHAGIPVRRALLWNLGSALTAFVGAGIALLLGLEVSSFAQTLVPVTAGGFVYLAAADLIPELQHEPVSPRASLGQVLGVLGGVGVMALLTMVR